ncbi:serine hydroxymethyltransferase [Dactylosporangium fulvum]|uniref:Probable serine hydroxymethyltransferase n=1 Tax=Dactylosporangium fulvum TaxID=53359 RepID=A0ABY5WA47_9ACTN|nr:serine hydroxymethyltransferase [Dactylosporangium fulvum]UWP86089.1 serine hydroxymethyltransferase [Dactylosporangium fulvum]
MTVVRTDRPAGSTLSQGELLQRGADQLRRDDPVLAGLLDDEVRYQNDMLPLVAYASIEDPTVLFAAGSALSNVTAEGYPGARYHPGTRQFDAIERLAVERAMRAFGARYANVQPHSCSSANLTVLFTLLAPGDTLLGLALSAGGHLTHGSSVSVTGRYLNAVHYGLTPAGWIDYERMAELAHEHRPKLIVAGASAYPRIIDYARFRAVADAVGAWLLADVSHIAGLVAAGVHPSPIDVAHVTTASTYKQLGGPRGGLILLGRDADAPSPDGRGTLADLMQRGVFPRLQGTPNPAGIAAKARAFDLLARPEFTETARAIVAGARRLAAGLAVRGHRILTGGTDNHIVLVDVLAAGMTGAVAEAALQECGVLANKNQLPGDRKPATVTSGLRLGTNMLAQRRFTGADVDECAALVADVLAAVRPVDDLRYELAPQVVERTRRRVAELVRRRPVAAYQR